MYNLYPRFDYHKAMPTPWGKADSKYLICEGVYDVGTPGHGGIMVGKAQAKKLLSQSAISEGMEWNNWICFEEDCDWAIFAYEQPELYANSFKQHAIEPEKITVDYIKNIAFKSLTQWHDKYLNNRLAE